MNIKPNGMRPVHPGEILRDEFLVPLHMSASELSIQLKLDSLVIISIIQEKRAITADVAARLSAFFSTTPDFWMSIQASYDLRVAQLRLERDGQD